MNTDELNKITEVSPWINEDDMANVTPIKYKSRDGLTIHGYLTLPKGYTMENAKNLPVVVNPHGGPWARDNWGFNPEIQFLANRGYAVLQMNFRGSTGYGREFWTISFKQWGLTMQDDITDGVIWLIDQGIADAEKIAIYGGSYGGYATLQGIVVTPELYAAAVDYVGVSNLFTFMKTIPPYWKPFLDMMYEMVGNPVADSAQLAATSPALNADKIITPLFVAQGANDPRVNINESDQMVNALKERGIDVEYMVKDNEGHGFRNEENRFDFYRAMEKFLSAHLKDAE
jgi:dipeptidyl aminopeptidase/acylaminoacyl peptidase